MHFRIALNIYVLIQEKYVFSDKIITLEKSLFIKISEYVIVETINYFYFYYKKIFSYKKLTRIVKSLFI